jgi:hypothetical protein
MELKYDFEGDFPIGASRRHRASASDFVSRITRIPAVPSPVTAGGKEAFSQL